MSPRKRTAQSDEENEPSTPKQAASARKHVRLDVADEHESNQQQRPRVAVVGNGGGGDVAARVVTPHQPKVGGGEVVVVEEGDAVRQKLFLGSGEVAASPSNQQQTNDDDVQQRQVKTVSPVKRKLIFGRSVVEIDVKNSVRLVYNIVRKLTGSIGGNGSFGPIYGELTMGSMQKMINLMKEHAEFDASSRFIDVGSGIGKPNLHVTQDPGVEFSYGIEVEADRWLLGMNCLKGMLDGAQEQQGKMLSEGDKILHNCTFVHGDITDAHTFDPFTHVYMFSIGFPPSLWCDLSDMWNRSSSKYLICYHAPKDIIDSYEFNVELVVQTQTSMHGSKEGHMGYIYRRTAGEAVGANNEIVACDPYYAPALEKVKSGFESIKEDVDSKVEEKMRSGTSTRSRRRR